MHNFKIEELENSYAARKKVYNNAVDALEAFYKNINPIVSIIQKSNIKFQSTNVNIIKDESLHIWLKLEMDYSGGIFKKKPQTCTTLYHTDDTCCFQMLTNNHLAEHSVPFLENFIMKMSHINYEDLIVDIQREIVNNFIFNAGKN